MRHSPPMMEQPPIIMVAGRVLPHTWGAATQHIPPGFLPQPTHTGADFLPFPGCPLTKEGNFGAAERPTL